MAGPLSGYRILDATQMVSGPMAVMILGDQGADVIKIEPTTTGDLTRALGGRRAGISPVFATTNRNKRSLAVDLKSDRGREILEHLVSTADVFVQNFRPGAVERLGIDYPSLRRIKADLIYVSINGFGEHGPYADKRVYDPVIQAISGLADIQADRNTGRPQMMRLIVPDKVTALTAAQAITAALLHHHRTGEGQHVRLSMLDAVVSFLWPEGMAEYTMMDLDRRSQRPMKTRDLIFETTDGYITVGALSDGEWAALTRVLGRPEWQDDARFKSPSARIRNSELRLEMTAAVLRSRSSSDWLERLEAEHVPCAPVLSREQLLDDPQVAANALIVEEDHPYAGRIRQTRPAARFERSPAELRRPAPRLGEHSGEILAELGYDAERITSLVQAGIVAIPEARRPRSPTR